MIVIHDVEQGTDEWLRLRADRYTGSNADKLLRYASHLKVVDGVASGYSLAEISGFTGNFYTRRGHILEDEAIDLYSKITGHMVSRPGFVTNTKWPKLGYSPDGHDDTLQIPLEVKAFNAEKHLSMFNAKDALDLPLKVTSQIHFGQFVWEKRGARLIIYNPDFARKLDDEGNPNPIYDPSKALKIIDIQYNRSIQSNFKRVIQGAI